MPIAAALLILSLSACSLDTSILPPDEDGGVATDGAADTGRDAIITPPDGCVPSAEVCNESDDDCDGRSDEGFDTSRDPENCGACGSLCPVAPANAAAACVSGRCEPRCDEGFENCNGDVGDGCEAALSSAENCGACGAACGGATPFCQASDGARTCVADCGAGTRACGASCVDTNSDVLNCGACGTMCPARPNAVTECLAGACSFRCDEGFADCNGDVADGCEADLSSIETCGACGNSCSRPHVVSSCDGTGCVYGVCEAGYGDCDGSSTNGCENTLDSTAHCGGCSVECAPPGGNGNCSSGTCELSACIPPFENCDGNDANGCEVSGDIDEDHCGACNTPCSGICNGRRCDADCGGVDCVSGCTAAAPCACNSGSCGWVCAEPVCDAACQGSGISCTALGNRPSNFTGECRGGADCAFEVRYGDAIAVLCTNMDTSCEIDCRNTGSCQVDCRSDASCRLRCQGATSCGFSRCDGGETSCATGVVVCNGDC